MPGGGGGVDHNCNAGTSFSWTEVLVLMLFCPNLAKGSK